MTTATAAAAPTCMMLPIKDIRVNGGTQLRQEISQDTVQDYSEVLDELPPIVVFEDDKGQRWLADGHHRLRAALFASRDVIQCEIRKGSRRDAVLFAAGCNAKHGLRRSNACKRRCVMALLSDREWCRWSDREIARQAAVSAAMVTVLRREVTGPPKPNERRLASHNGRIVSRPAEHHKQDASANGHSGTATTVRCPFCKREFAAP